MQEWQGQSLILPGAYSSINDSALSGPSSPGTGIVAVLGLSAMGGGVLRKTPIPVSDAQSGRRLFGTGPLADGIDRAFSHGAPQVIAVSVNPALQSQAALSDASTIATINLLTNDSGQWTAGIRVRIDPATNAAINTGALKVTITTPTVGPNLGQAIVGDNLYLAPFTLYYSGAGTAPGVTITGTQLTTAVTGDVPSVLTLPFATYPTVADLVSALNAGGKWVATVQGGASTLASSALDGLAAIVVSIVSTAPTPITAIRQTVINWFNSTGSANVFQASSGALGSLTAATSLLPPATIATVPLTGGVDGTTTPTDWANALSSLQQQNCDLVVPMSGDPAVHAATQAHVDYMCGPGKKERLAIVGGFLGETLTTFVAANSASRTVTARASTLNDQNMLLVWPGPQDYDWQGVLAYRDAFYAAPMVAARLAAGGVQRAATHAPLNIAGLELQNGMIIQSSTVSQALLSGVCCLEYANYFGSKGFRVAQSITTWLNDLNYAKREASTVRTKYFVVRSIREAIDSQLIGHGVASQGAEDQAKTIATGMLTTFTDAGMLVGNAANPAFKNITTSVSGDTMQVGWSCSVAIPLNYAELSASITAFAG
jgi:hypothetical protein